MCGWERVLPARAARRANIAVAAVYVPVSVFNVVGETWYAFYWCGAAVEAALLLLMIRHAWAWPRVAATATSHRE